MNDSHQRSILFTFLDVHRRMADMEAQVVQAGDPSPFTSYVADLSPIEARVVRDYFCRIREAMRCWLAECDIPLAPKRTSLRWALQCGTSFLGVAVSEIAPSRLAGYGPLGAGDPERVVRIQEDLQRLIDRASAYLHQGSGRDLDSRLAATVSPAGLREELALLDRLVTRHGLVEFRPQLDAVVARLESPRPGVWGRFAPNAFEVAVFGRVSCGKSSLLNDLVGRDVLPVGVTPVTAVPVWLAAGEEAEAVVCFAEFPPRAFPPADLALYASEQGNPGNHKHVTQIGVRLPSPRLQEGVVLVDTPGVGSLARTGGAETLAYLPRCDLGIVLIDAASTLAPDDLDLLHLLHEAGVPAHVLLSKADLLRPGERQQAAEYVQDQVRRELGLDVPVHPVSTVGADEALLTRWFDQHLAPLLERHHALAKESVERKVGLLRGSVSAVLQALLSRRNGGIPASERLARDGKEMRRRLDQAGDAVRIALLDCRHWSEQTAALFDVALEEGARALAAAARNSAGESLRAGVQQVLTERDRHAREIVAKLQQALTGHLSSLHELDPTARIDVSVVRDLELRGLPLLDLRPLSGHLDVPPPRLVAWWPWLARRRALRTIERRCGSLLRGRIETHDRQLRAWLEGQVRRLAERFESQAEVVREQLRRAGHTPAATEGEPAADDLRADVEQLRRFEADGRKEAGTPQALAER